MLDGLPIARFPKPVHMESKRSVEEATSVLQGLTRSFFARGNREALFVGNVTRDGGRVWFHRRQTLTSPARSLRFRLVPNETGCKLVAN